MLYEYETISVFSMEKFEKSVKCNSCLNKYTEQELRLFDEISESKTETFLGCPECKTDEFLMNIDVEK
jgi:Zn finger protein HypA/HybF involved in hydrogenase expression